MSEKKKKPTLRKGFVDLGDKRTFVAKLKEDPMAPNLLYFEKGKRPKKTDSDQPEESEPVTKPKREDYSTRCYLARTSEYTKGVEAKAGEVWLLVFEADKGGFEMWQPVMRKKSAPKTREELVSALKAHFGENAIKESK